MRFVNTGLDQEITKSFISNRTPEEVESLTKGIDKSKLVQVETTVNGKNGTFTRKQWKKAGDVDPKKDHVVGGEQPTEDKSPKEEKKPSGDIKFECKDGNTKGAMAQLLVDGHSRDDIMAAAKSQGITWEEKDHPAINWMRCSMAIQKHMKSNAGSTEAAEEPKKEDTSQEQPTEDKTSKEESKENKDSNEKPEEDKTSDDTDKVDSDEEDSDDDEEEDEDEFKLSEKEQGILDSLKKDKNWTSDGLQTGTNDDDVFYAVNHEMDEEFSKPFFKTTYGAMANGDAGDSDDPDSENWMSAEEVQKEISKSTESKKDEKPTTEKKESVIGKNYTSLTEEDEADTIEGEAHNMIVGRLRSKGEKNPSDFDVRSEALDLAKQNIRSNIVSGNVHSGKLGDRFLELAGGVDKKYILKDIAEGTSETKESRAWAFKELADSSGSKDYYVDRDNSIRQDVNTGGKYQTEVRITPSKRGTFTVEFTYDDGKSRKETYDTAKSARDASDKFLAEETKRGKSAKTSSSVRSAILDGTHTIKAKSEKDAISKINKQLKEEGLDKDGTGHYWKITKDKYGYNGDYTLTESFAFNNNGKVTSRSTGSSQGGFYIKDAGNGEFKIQKYTGSGYNGQD